MLWHVWSGSHSSLKNLDFHSEFDHRYFCGLLFPQIFGETQQQGYAEVTWTIWHDFNSLHIGKKPQVAVRSKLDLFRAKSKDFHFTRFLNKSQGVYIMWYLVFLVWYHNSRSIPLDHNILSFISQGFGSGYWQDTWHEAGQIWSIFYLWNRRSIPVK